MAATARILWQKGWAEAGAGNMSVNVSEFYRGIAIDFRTFPLLPLQVPAPALAGQFLLVSCKGSRMRELAGHPAAHLCLVKFNKTGDAYQLLFEDLENPNEPTSELFTHFGVQAQMISRGTGEKAVLHTHATDLIALSHFPGMQDEKKLNDILLRMHSETAFFLPDGIGFVPFEPPGSKALADKAIAGLERHKVILWEKHGCLATGGSISDAFDRIDLFSKAARIYLICRNAGIEPEGLTDQQLQSLYSQV